MLYQRYFLRMNQSNTTHILVLLLALMLTVASVQIAFVSLQIRQGSTATSTDAPAIEQNLSGNFTKVKTISNLRILSDIKTISRQMSDTWNRSLSVAASRKYYHQQPQLNDKSAIGEEMLQSFSRFLYKTPPNTFQQIPNDDTKHTPEMKYHRQQVHHQQEKQHDYLQGLPIDHLKPLSIAANTFGLERKYHHHHHNHQHHQYKRSK